MEWITTTRILEELRSSNDGDAWTFLIRCFRPMLVSFGRRMGLSEADSEDASQETLLVFVEKLRADKYVRDKGRLSNWLFGVARKVILKHLKRSSTEKLTPNSGTNVSSCHIAADTVATQDTWDIEWGRMILTRCLDQVSREFTPRVVEAFRLYAIDGKSAKEVGERLNMSRNAVYIAKSRILSRVSELKDEFEERV